MHNKICCLNRFSANSSGALSKHTHDVEPNPPPRSTSRLFILPQPDCVPVKHHHPSLPPSPGDHPSAPWVCERDCSRGSPMCATRPRLCFCDQLGCTGRHVLWVHPSRSRGQSPLLFNSRIIFRRMCTRFVFITVRNALHETDPLSTCVCL